MPEEEYLEKKKIIKELYKERNALKKKTKTKLLGSSLYMDSFIWNFSNFY